jgi:hypothetical protein
MNGNQIVRNNQISGWIASEVGRRKKKSVLKAVEEVVFQGAVEDLEELEEGVDTNLLPVELINCYGKQDKKQVQSLAQLASNAMLSQLKGKWRVKRPASCVEEEPRTVCIDLTVDLAVLKAKWRPRRVGGR